MLRAQGGFTLIETVVAMAVFASVIVVLQRGSAISLRAIQQADSDQRALALARIKLASAVAAGAAAERLVEGSDLGIDWQVHVSKYASPDNVASPPRTTAYWVNVKVSWRDRPLALPRVIALQSLVLGDAP